jgi:hypothetical protein
MREYEIKDMFFISLVLENIINWILNALFCGIPSFHYFPTVKEVCHVGMFVVLEVKTIIFFLFSWHQD